MRAAAPGTCPGRPAVRIHAAQLALALGGAGLVAGCARAKPEETATAAYPSVDVVTDRPEAYLGERLTVHGTLTQVRSPQCFEIQDHDWIFPEALLVFAPDQSTVGDLGLNDLEGRAITVRGTLRRVVVSEVEQESDVDLDPAFELEVENRPVLVAERVWLDPAARQPSRRRGD